MEPIPKPQTLDPDRPLRDHGTKMTEPDRSEAELLATALRESCAYADQLWDNLDAMRHYLLDSLPPDPRTPGPQLTSASPTGPDDDLGWSNWVDAFAAVSSVLCGAHGDSGSGLGKARREATLRRSAAVLDAHANPEEGAPQRHPEEGDTSEPERRSELPSGSGAPEAGDTETLPGTTEDASATFDMPAGSTGWTPGRTAAVLAVAALALRELRGLTARRGT